MPSPGEKRITTPQKTASGTPKKHLESSGAHDFSLQYVMDIQRSLGAMETAVKGLTGALDKHDSRLQILSDKIVSAEGSFKVIKLVGGVMGSVALALLGAIAAAALRHWW